MRKLLPALLACVLASASPARPPNIVFILADDLGWRDLGSFGSTFYETPNLDQLAAAGARFSAAYAACPVCSPSRAAILTGRWPQRSGITDYIGSERVPENWKRNTRSLPAPYEDRLDLQVPTLAKTLKAAGYATFFAGKWHLGPEGWWPENQGFDFNLGGHDRGGPYGGGKYFSPYGNPRLTDGPPGEHLPDRLAAEAERFIEANRSKPFLVYLSFYDVHTPLMARPDLLRKYKEKRARLGLETVMGVEPPRKVRQTQDHAVYAGMVDAMDQAVGRVLRKLDEAGLRENTVVIFTSDNGGLSTSEGSPTSNLPLRAGKGWMYEGGIRVPMILRWPGVARPGAVIHSPVYGPDFMPTLLEAAGIAPAPPTDGVSLLPLLRGQPVPARPLFWCYPHYGNQGGAPAAAIRLGDWKLIRWLEDDRLELFDLAKDPGERSNLAAAEPERAEVLRRRLDEWLKATNARLPVPNPRHRPDGPDGRGTG